jgi:ribosomal protein L31
MEKRLKPKLNKKRIVFTNGASFFFKVSSLSYLNLETDPYNHFIWNSKLKNKTNKKIGQISKFITKFKIK